MRVGVILKYEIRPNIRFCSLNEQSGAAFPAIAGRQAPKKVFNSAHHVID